MKGKYFGRKPKHFITLKQCVSIANNKKVLVLLGFSFKQFLNPVTVK